MDNRHHCRKNQSVDARMRRELMAGKASDQVLQRRGGRRQECPHQRN